MPITIYPGTVQKRNSDGTYSDLVPGVVAGTDIIADEYDSTSGVYSIGDYCVYQDVLYKCITAILVSEAFDSSKWEEITVSEEISGVKNTLTSKADKSDLTSLNLTGTTNTSGSQIDAGTYFYLNGALVKAKTDIADGATFTNGTNYETVTAGGLNDLNNNLNMGAIIPFPKTIQANSTLSISKEELVSAGMSNGVYLISFGNSGPAPSTILCLDVTYGINIYLKFSGWMFWGGYVSIMSDTGTTLNSIQIKNSSTQSEYGFASIYVYKLLSH